jgi:hypothetical protein
MRKAAAACRLMDLIHGYFEVSGKPVIYFRLELDSVSTG